MLAQFDTTEFDMSDGLVIRAATHGSGPPILLVHGLGGGAIDFQDHIEWFARFGRVLGIDLRGHGSSDAPEATDAYSLRRLALDIAEVADALTQPLRCVVAHSMGGIVLRTALIHLGLQAESLVWFGTTAGPIPGITPGMADAAADLITREGLVRFRQVLERLDPLGSKASQEYHRTHPNYRAIQDWRWAHTSASMYAAMLPELARLPDESPLLQAVGAPSLVMCGEEDESFVGPSRALAAALPGGRLEMIPHAGHHPQLHQPERWRSAIGKLLMAD